MSNRFLFNICTDPAAVILCSGSRYGGWFTTLRFDKCFLRPRNSFPLEVLLTLFQPDRIFGRDRRGKKKPGTFDFLGLTHIWARSRRGKFTVQVRTMRKRLRRSLTAIAEWCQEHRHAPVDEQHKTLNAKLRGHCPDKLSEPSEVLSGCR